MRKIKHCRVIIVHHRNVRFNNNRNSFQNRSFHSSHPATTIYIYFSPSICIHGIWKDRSWKNSNRIKRFAQSSRDFLSKIIPHNVHSSNPSTFPSILIFPSPRNTLTNESQMYRSTPRKRILGTNTRYTQNTSLSPLVFHGEKRSTPSQDDLDHHRTISSPHHPQTLTTDPTRVEIPPRSRSFDLWSIHPYRRRFRGNARGLPIVVNTSRGHLHSYFHR